MSNAGLGQEKIVLRTRINNPLEYRIINLNSVIYLLNQFVNQFIMKTIKTTSAIVAGLAMLMVLLTWSGCDPTVPPRDPNPNDTIPREERMDLKTEKIEPKRVEGGKYPEIRPDFEKIPNNDTKPIKIPDGPQRGKLEPENKQYVPKQLKEDPRGSGDSQAPLYYRDFENFPNSAPFAHPLVPEPSVAENGQTVMTTGNFWVSLSEDGGGTWNTVNPTTIFPNDYGGFCCDQVLNYVPEYDLFVWLLQYNTGGDGRNAIRIAVQTTEGVRNSNGTAWVYWDFPNTLFDAGGGLDYNDMSYGRQNLYWTSSVNGASNRYVVRIPLAELRAMGTINFSYTGATNAIWSHVSQNGRNGVYWAGHKNNSTMTVWSMMDGDGFYSWRDVNINSWPNATISSIAANGTDWLLDANWKTYIRAAAVRDNRVYFAWNASAGNGFPQPHVQIVGINTSTWVREEQMQIWNPDFAFAYPYFEYNAQGELGMIVAFGGGPFNASSGVGVWGDFVIYYPTLSGSSPGNYGHYHTARRSGDKPMEWVGAGYTYNADGTILPYYVRFSH